MTYDLGIDSMFDGGDDEFLPEDANIILNELQNLYGISKYCAEQIALGRSMAWWQDQFEDILIELDHNGKSLPDLTLGKPGAWD